MEILKKLSPYFCVSNLSRQFASLLSLKQFIGWEGMEKWLLRYGLRVVPVAAGSIGMGCIGYPRHPVIEVTSDCNLSCIHCHVGSEERGITPPFEDLAEVIKRIAAIKEFGMIAFTGGEPLVRPDLMDLIELTSKAGLYVVIATNGTLIDRKTARELKKRGVVGVAVSVDSILPDLHDKIRGREYVYEQAIRGIEACLKEKIVVQINVTAMKENAHQIGRIMEWSDSAGAGIGLIYQLIPIGSGASIKDQTLLVDENRKLIKLIKETQSRIKTIFEPVASPQYWPYLIASGNNAPLARKLAQWSFHGCSAGWGLLYMKANGDVWPCPFVNISAGNAFQRDIKEIWEKSEVFTLLRDRNNLKGACGECKYRNICGGCRAKALAYNGDYLAEDPTCFVREDFDILKS